MTKSNDPFGRDAVLALADGQIFRGRSIGVSGQVAGEVVFTTSMSGYQEVLTDPSYRRQIVAMTCAEIGNVGTNEEDQESGRIQAVGLVVRSSRDCASNWRSSEGFRDYLKRHGLVALEDVDTRSLVLHTRTQGAQIGVIASDASNIDALVQAARKAPGMAGQDLAQEVSTRASYVWREAPSELQSLAEQVEGLDPLAPKPSVVAYDLGMKRSILRRLVEVGLSVRVVPANTSAEDVLALKPDGVFFSNGPGDPEPCTYAVEAAKKLVGRLPVFGICLGHQILGIAYGGRSFKLKFGHRGSNQPVQRKGSHRVHITSQNHGFAIDTDSLTRGSSKAEVTELNLNDDTLEGFEVPSDRVWAVQYHPEASPGPHDASGHFRVFADACRRHAGS
jgi:carbamoyl-phosphate synthase small subunit